MKLGFNIDHIATLRNARGEGYPNIIEVAKLAVAAGANQITAHLREDRRHIKDQDMINLKANITVPLNMEMAATAEMVKIALNLKPYAVCLVPERREELTTEGGLNVTQSFKAIKLKVETLAKAGIKTVLFIDAAKEQVEAALNMPIFGVEFNTGKYANAKSPTAKQHELNNITTQAKIIVKNNKEAHAGHGLNYANVPPIAAIREITELNIGHFLVAESLIVGIQASIKKMAQIINANRN